MSSVRKEIRNRYMNQTVEKNSSTFLYHGSRNKFHEFNLEFLGLNGTAQGFGVYLTPNKDIAEMYSEKGYLYTLSVDLENELSLTELTIARGKISEIINILHNTTDILNDINDVEYYGKEYVKKELLGYLQDNENDVDLLNDFANITGDRKAVTEAFYKVGKYTHILAEEQTRIKGYVVVVLDPKKIKILDVESKIEKTSQLEKMKSYETEIEKDVGDKPFER